MNYIRTSQNPPVGVDKIQRRIDLSRCVATIVGNVIGTGIFVSSVGVLQYTWSVETVLVVWSVTGFLTVLGALCYIKLGLTFPKSGNNFTYTQIIYGNLLAFLYLWLYVLVVIPCSLVISSMIFASYISKPFFSTCPIQRSCIRIIAVLCLSLLTYINHRSVDWSVKVQKFFTVSKITTLIVIIIAGTVHLFQGNTENFENPLQGSSVDPLLYIVLASYPSIFSYSGWDLIVEEVQNPIRNLTRSILISLPIVTVVYIFSNLAHFSVASCDDRLNSEAVIASFGEGVHSFMAWIMPLCIACSIIGIMNSAVYGFSRLLYVGARKKLLPSWLVNIHHYTPSPNLLFCCLLSFVYLITTEVLILIKYVKSIATTFTLMSVCGMSYMRFRRPDIERPIKINILVLLLYIISLVALISVTILEFLETLIGIAMTLAGILIYYASVKWKNKSNFCKRITDWFTLLVQKLLLCVLEEENDINR